MTVAKTLGSLAVVFLVGCGIGATDDSKTPVATSQAALACSDQPRINADGTATSIGCSFEQQWENITHHGTKLAAPAALLSGGNAVGVQVTYQCGEWVMGQDSSGITVFVSSVDGTVRSHGALHAGFPVSSLSQTLSLPISEH